MDVIYPFSSIATPTDDTVSYPDLFTPYGWKVTTRGRKSKTGGKMQLGSDKSNKVGGEEGKGKGRAGGVMGMKFEEWRGNVPPSPA